MRSPPGVNVLGDSRIQLCVTGEEAVRRGWYTRAVVEGLDMNVELENSDFIKEMQMKRSPLAKIL